jgi:hypothetical protein
VKSFALRLSVKHSASRENEFQDQKAHISWIALFTALSGVLGEAEEDEEEVNSSRINDFLVNPLIDDFSAVGIQLTSPENNSFSVLSAFRLRELKRKLVRSGGERGRFTAQLSRAIIVGGTNYERLRFNFQSFHLLHPISNSPDSGAVIYFAGRKADCRIRS